MAPISQEINVWKDQGNSGPYRHSKGKEETILKRQIPDSAPTMDDKSNKGVVDTGALSALEQCAVIHSQHQEDYQQFFGELHRMQDELITEMTYYTEQLSSMTSSINYPEVRKLKKIMEGFPKWRHQVESLYIRSQFLVPVNLRTKRIDYSRSVVVLCDYFLPKVRVKAGDVLILINNTDEKTWQVVDKLGQKFQIPAVYSLIPPPDVSSIETVQCLREVLLDTWEYAAKDLKDLYQSLNIFRDAALKTFERNLVMYRLQVTRTIGQSEDFSSKQQHFIDAIIHSITPSFSQYPCTTAEPAISQRKKHNKKLLFRSQPNIQYDTNTDIRTENKTSLLRGKDTDSMTNSDKSQVSQQTSEKAPITDRIRSFSLTPITYESMTLSGNSQVYSDRRYSSSLDLELKPMALAEDDYYSEEVDSVTSDDLEMDQNYSLDEIYFAFDTCAGADTEQISSVDWSSKRTSLLPMDEKNPITATKSKRRHRPTGLNDSDMDKSIIEECVATALKKFHQLTGQNTDKSETIPKVPLSQDRHQNSVAPERVIADAVSVALEKLLRKSSSDLNDDTCMSAASPKRDMSTNGIYPVASESRFSFQPDDAIYKGVGDEEWLVIGDQDSGGGDSSDEDIHTSIEDITLQEDELNYSELNIYSECSTYNTSLKQINIDIANHEEFSDDKTSEHFHNNQDELKEENNIFDIFKENAKIMAASVEDVMNLGRRRVSDLVARFETVGGINRDEQIKIDAKKDEFRRVEEDSASSMEAAVEMKEIKPDVSLKSNEHDLEELSDDSGVCITPVLDERRSSDDNVVPLTETVLVETNGNKNSEHLIGSFDTTSENNSKILRKKVKSSDDVNVSKVLNNLKKYLDKVSEQGLSEKPKKSEHHFRDVAKEVMFKNAIIKAIQTYAEQHDMFGDGQSSKGGKHTSIGRLTPIKEVSIENNDLLSMRKIVHKVILENTIIHVLQSYNEEKDHFESKEGILPKYLENKSQQPAVKQRQLSQVKRISPETFPVDLRPDNTMHRAFKDVFQSLKNVSIPEDDISEEDQKMIDDSLDMFDKILDEYISTSSNIIDGPDSSDLFPCKIISHAMPETFLKKETIPPEAMISKLVAYPINNMNERTTPQNISGTQSKKTSCDLNETNENNETGWLGKLKDRFESFSTNLFNSTSPKTPQSTEKDEVNVQSRVALFENLFRSDKRQLDVGQKQNYKHEVSMHGSSSIHQNLDEQEIKDRTYFENNSKSILESPSQPDICLENIGSEQKLPSVSLIQKHKHYISDHKEELKQGFELDCSVELIENVKSSTTENEEIELRINDTDADYDEDSDTLSDGSFDDSPADNCLIDYDEEDDIIKDVTDDEYEFQTNVIGDKPQENNSVEPEILENKFDSLLQFECLDKAETLVVDIVEEYNEEQNILQMGQWLLPSSKYDSPLQQQMSANEFCVKDRFIEGESESDSDESLCTVCTQIRANSESAKASTDFVDENTTHDYNGSNALYFDLEDIPFVDYEADCIKSFEYAEKGVKDDEELMLKLVTLQSNESQPQGSNKDHDDIWNLDEDYFNQGIPKTAHSIKIPSNSWKTIPRDCTCDHNDSSGDQMVMIKEFDKGNEHEESQNVLCHVDELCCWINDDSLNEIECCDNNQDIQIDLDSGKVRKVPASNSPQHTANISLSSSSGPPGRRRNRRRHGGGIYGANDDAYIKPNRKLDFEVLSEELKTHGVYVIGPVITKGPDLTVLYPAKYPLQMDVVSYRDGISVTFGIDEGPKRSEVIKLYLDNVEDEPKQHDPYNKYYAYNPDFIRPYVPEPLMQDVDWLSVPFIDDEVEDNAVDKLTNINRHEEPWMIPFPLDFQKELFEPLNPPPKRTFQVPIINSTMEKDYRMDKSVSFYSGIEIFEGKLPEIPSSPIIENEDKVYRCIIEDTNYIPFMDFGSDICTSTKTDSDSLATNETASQENTPQENVLQINAHFHNKTIKHVQNENNSVVENATRCNVTKPTLQVVKFEIEQPVLEVHTRLECGYVKTPPQKVKQQTMTEMIQDKSTLSPKPKPRNNISPDIESVNLEQNTRNKIEIDQKCQSTVRIQGSSTSQTKPNVHVDKPATKPKPKLKWKPIVRKECTSNVPNTSNIGEPQPSISGIQTTESKSQSFFYGNGETKKHSAVGEPARITRPKIPPKPKKSKSKKVSSNSYTLKNPEPQPFLFQLENDTRRREYQTQTQEETTFYDGQVSMNYQMSDEKHLHPSFDPNQHITTCSVRDGKGEMMSSFIQLTPEDDVKINSKKPMSLEHNLLISNTSVMAVKDQKINDIPVDISKRRSKPKLPPKPKKKNLNLVVSTQVFSIPPESVSQSFIPHTQENTPPSEPTGACAFGDQNTNHSKVYKGQLQKPPIAPKPKIILDNKSINMQNRTVHGQYKESQKIIEQPQVSKVQEIRQPEQVEIDEQNWKLNNSQTFHNEIPASMPASMGHLSSHPQSVTRSQAMNVPNLRENDFVSSDNASSEFLGNGDTRPVSSYHSENRRQVIVPVFDRGYESEIDSSIIESDDRSGYMDYTHSDYEDQFDIGPSASNFQKTKHKKYTVVDINIDTDYSDHNVQKINREPRIQSRVNRSSGTTQFIDDEGSYGSLAQSSRFRSLPDMDMLTSDCGMYEEWSVVQRLRHSRTQHDVSTPHVVKSEALLDRLAKISNTFASKRQAISNLTVSGSSLASEYSDAVMYTMQDLRQIYNIASVYDPWGQLISLEDAVSSRIIDLVGGTYVNPLTEYTMTIAEAIGKGYIIQDPKSTTTKFSSSYGLITFYTKTRYVPCTIRNVYDTVGGRSRSLDMAKMQGLISEHDDIYIDKRNQRKMTIDEAIDDGYIEVDFDDDVFNSMMVYPKEEDMETKVEVFLCIGVMDPFLRRRIPFRDALVQGLIDRDLGVYTHHVTNESTPIRDAIESGYVFAKPVKGSIGVYDSLIEPWNRLAFEHHVTKRKHVQPREDSIGNFTSPVRSLRVASAPLSNHF